MRVAQPISLSPDQRRTLQQQARGRSLPARVVERARIILRAADGLQDKEIAAELGIRPETVARWRNRFLKGGWSAVEQDASRPGRPRTITNARVKRVVEMTTRQKPDNATRGVREPWQPQLA
jgi:transposase